MSEIRTNITVLIRKNETGEVRAIPDWTFIDEDGTPFTYLWEEGNFGCDCNRSLFFARAGGEPETDIQCGGELYSIKIVWNDKCIYAEFD